MRAPSRTLLGGLAAATLLTLAACSDDGSDDGSDGATPASASPSASPATDNTAEPTADPTAEPTAEPTAGSTAFPGVTPAAGPELGLDTFTVRAPEGWTVDPQTVSGQTTTASSPDGLLQLVEQAGAADLPLEQRAEIYLQGQYDDVETERLPNVSIGEPGVEAFRFQWVDPELPDEVNQDVSTVRNGYTVNLSMRVERKDLRRDPQLFDSVLASLTWR